MPKDTPSADASAIFLAEMVRTRNPFSFFRFGDGAIECIYHPEYAGRTCDGEVYSKELGARLRFAWSTIMLCARSRLVFVGDWSSASFLEKDRTYETEWNGLAMGATRAGCHFLHFDALLFHRPRVVDLMKFYNEIRTDPRKKLLIAPATMAPAAKNLGMMHLVSPMGNLGDWIRKMEVEKLLVEEMDYDVCLFGAGMEINVPIAKAFSKHQARTFINIGSSLDPIFCGKKTRSHQIDPLFARTEFIQRLGTWRP